MNAPADPVFLQRSVETDAVRALRKRIELAGSHCLKRAERAATYDAGIFMLRGAQIASAWTWAPAPEGVLEDVIRLLTALNVAANVSERLEAGDAE